MISRLASTLRRLANAMDGDSDTIAFRIAIDPEMSPRSVRERFEARARAEKEAAELRERVARLEASRQEPPPPPMPRSDVSRYSSMGDLAGEVGGLNRDQLHWLLATRPVGFAACLFLGEEGSHPIVDRRSFARWISAQNGIGHVRGCLPSVPLAPEDLAYCPQITRLIDVPVLDQYQLEALIPELDARFGTDEDIARRFADNQIGRFKIEPILSLAEKEQMSRLPRETAPRAAWMRKARPGVVLPSHWNC